MTSTGAAIASSTRVGEWRGLDRRSRPYVHLTNVYVNDTYRNV